MRSQPAGERIALELLDAQGNTLAIGIDRQNRSLDLLALAVIANRFLARQIPGDIRQMHETIDRAVQTDEDAEIGNRLDLSRHFVATVMGSGKLGPRIGLALLDAQ